MNSNRNLRSVLLEFKKKTSVASQRKKRENRKRGSHAFCSKMTQRSVKGWTKSHIRGRWAGDTRRKGVMF